MATELIKEGHVYGQWRYLVNEKLDKEGSIHSDAFADKVGFRGGLVAATAYFELFPPLLLEVFGQRWFERGSLSFHMMNPVLHGEEVRPVMQMPSGQVNDVQVEAWCERRDELHCAEGTAAVGKPGALPALSTRKLDSYPTGQLRILAGIKKGDVLPTIDVSVDRAQAGYRLGITTDPLPWYVGPSPWGGAIATPRSAIEAITQGDHSSLREQLRESGNPGGLWGALELRYINGPVMVDKPYRAGGVVVHVGTSPKTEYAWVDYFMEDEHGTRVAEMRVQSRWPKAASPLYAGEV